MTDRQDIKVAMSRIMGDRNLFPLDYKNFYFNGVGQLARNHLIFDPPEEDGGLLPFKNGVLDIASKALKPNDPGYSFTWQLPYEYESAATCEPILQWLYETVGGSTALVELLRAFLYAVLFGCAQWHRFLELIGPGGTGKSIFMWLTEQVVGSANTIATELKFLENSRFETASIYLKRLVLITDSERYGGGVKNLMRLTGGDPLRFEVKHKQMGKAFRACAMVIVAANEPIQSKEYTSGLSRRRIPVRFRNEVPIEKQRDLSKEFTPYIAGLINWVLGMDREEARKILKSRGSEEQILDFKENLLATNPMAEWLHENTLYVPQRGMKTYVGVAKKIRDDRDLVYYEHEDQKLYPNYVKFCDVRGIRPFAQKRFRDLLSELIHSQLKLRTVATKRDAGGRL